jgi:hypothetical protein
LSRLERELLVLLLLELGVVPKVVEDGEGVGRVHDHGHHEHHPLAGLGIFDRQLGDILFRTGLRVDLFLFFEPDDLVGRPGDLVPELQELGRLA